MLRFEKIDYDYYEQYKEMLQEWRDSNTSLTPGILQLPCNDEMEYKNIINTAKMQKLEYIMKKNGMKDADII